MKDWPLRFLFVSLTAFALQMGPLGHSSGADNFRLIACAFLAISLASASVAFGKPRSR